MLLDLKLRERKGIEFLWQVFGDPQTSTPESIPDEDAINDTPSERWSKSAAPPTMCPDLLGKKWKSIMIAMKSVSVTLKNIQNRRMSVLQDSDTV